MNELVSAYFVQLITTQPAGIKTRGKDSTLFMCENQSKKKSEGYEKTAMELETICEKSVSYNSYGTLSGDPGYVRAGMELEGM